DTVGGEQRRGLGQPVALADAEEHLQQDQQFRPVDWIDGDQVVAVGQRARRLRVSTISATPRRASAVRHQARDARRYLAGRTEAAWPLIIGAGGYIRPDRR